MKEKIVLENNKKKCFSGIFRGIAVMLITIITSLFLRLAGVYLSLQMGNFISKLAHMGLFLGAAIIVFSTMMLEELDRWALWEQDRKTEE